LCWCFLDDRRFIDIVLIIADQHRLRIQARLGFGRGRHGLLWCRVPLGPTVLSVAPGAAEREVDLHRDFELDGIATELRHEFGLLGRVPRAAEGVVHLQRRDDPLPPARAHPQLGMACSAALDQRVHRLAGVGEPQLFSKPGVIGILYPLLGLFTRAWSEALLPCAAGRPIGPMAAGAVVEREITGAADGALAQLGELRYKGGLAVILLVDRARLALGLADHRCEFAYAGAECLGEIGALRSLAIPPG